MKKHSFTLFTILFIAFTLSTPFIGLFMPNDNFFVSLLGLTFGLSIIPLSTISFLLIKRLRRDYSIEVITITALKVLVITLAFSFPIISLEYSNPNDYDFQYQESAVNDFMASLIGLGYILSILIYVFYELPAIKGANKVDVVKIIYDIVFYFSIFVFLFLLITLFDCGSGAFIYLFGVVSILAVNSTTLSILIANPSKNDKIWKKYQAIAFVFWVTYIYTLSYVRDVFSSNGKCEVFLGPSDSGTILTLLLVILHIYVFRRKYTTINNVKLENNNK